jgi:protein-disulfide isomerase-like protein with CxxC motif
MHRVYEIFEVWPDGSLLKKAVVSGLEFAKVTLDALAERTGHECMAADATTRQVMAQRNVPRAKERMAKRIFQIAYDEGLGFRRAQLLRELGYGVISVMGNEAARILLSSIQHYDFFIVGHAAPESARREMVGWLKANYPSVKILALNPPRQQINNADYNAVQNGPESWLPIITERFATWRGAE